MDLPGGFRQRPRRRRRPRSPTRRRETITRREPPAPHIEPIFTDVGMVLAPLVDFVDFDDPPEVDEIDNDPPPLSNVNPTGEGLSMPLSPSQRRKFFKGVDIIIRIRPNQVKWVLNHIIRALSILQIMQLRSRSNRCVTLRITSKAQWRLREGIML